MTKREIVVESEKGDDEIELCKILHKTDGLIRFAVNEGLKKPQSFLEKSDGIQIINKFLSIEQIHSPLSNIVAHSLPDDNMCFVGPDVLWQSFLICYATHRPLVLSPDVIALVINQQMTSIIRNNPEEFRGKFVAFDDTKELVVDSDTDLLDPETDWMRIFNDIYSKIQNNATLVDTSVWLNNYSTTHDEERIASIATLMGTLESYFQYTVRHYICGIPEITLLGTIDDWEKLLVKIGHMKTLGFETWHSWLQPIIKEFIRTARGYPNMKFWKRVVMDNSDEFKIERTCNPVRSKITGWCRSFFPLFHSDSGRIDLNSSTNYTVHSSEVMRVGFNYHMICRSKEYIIPMELWAGVFCIVEDESTNALTPKIGWMVRKSDVESENIARLIMQDKNGGIDLDVYEIPKILLRLNHINKLTLRFENKASIPSWFYNLDINELIIDGETDRGTRELLKSKFANLVIKAPTSTI